MHRPVRTWELCAYVWVLFRKGPLWYDLLFLWKHSRNETLSVSKRENEQIFRQIYRPILAGKLHDKTMKSLNQMLQKCTWQFVTRKCDTNWDRKVSLLGTLQTRAHSKMVLKDIEKKSSRKKIWHFAARTENTKKKWMIDSFFLVNVLPAGIIFMKTVSSMSGWKQPDP